MTGAGPTQVTTSNPQTLDTQTLLLFAVEELDVHISELICAGSFSISANFHDWVADSLTTKIEVRLLAAQQTGRFVKSLQLGNVRAVIGHWVRHWACMEIKQHFGQYVQFCSCTQSSISRPMALAATPASAAAPWPLVAEGLDI